ncbi:MAG: YidC/Oxa1 family membrane protein insertase [Clostridia bacterium]|nr:YidC/Oxa1 family membrane protein insertase [Clostridia bacterium]
MLNFIAGLFGYLMNFICGIVQNYGLAIIIFTILVKLMLLPMSLKQQKSMEKAQKMQGLMQELQKKYGNDQEKFMQEYQKMLKENNTTMLGSTGCSGCLLNFIQLPILLGMFYMLVSPLTHIMKMDSEEILRYKDEIVANRKEQAIELLIANSGDELSGDLLDAEIAKINSGDDSNFIDPRYYEIEIIKEKEIMDLEFFGINLGEAASKNKGNLVLLIIPVLSGLLTALTVFLNNYINKKNGIVQPKPEDMEIPMPDMRVMNIMMPIMLFSVAYSIPQGVGLYWVTSNLIGIIQTVIQRIILDPKNKKVKELAEKNEVRNVEYEVVNDGENTTHKNVNANNSNKKNNSKGSNGNKKKKK